jgi:cysteine desulfurase
MHVPFTAIHGSVRFSLSRYNTAEEVEQLIELFPQVVVRLRRISPYWDVTQNAPRPTAPKDVPA